MQSLESGMVASPWFFKQEESLRLVSGGESVQTNGDEHNLTYFGLC